eukprot:TRINITY_DN5034_c0_g1_i1.p1 TRINITY_DN5034_c0_g1~~TRINITY_DN5034_c0_g1_i1.p1  ORF type:complete len:335 (-),score=84.42 TRINITY_DN5034_c0_g1_i1:504-1508(-)
MPTEGFTIKKSHIFCGCGCLSSVGFFIFLAYVIATMQMQSAIGGVCERVAGSVDYQCKVVQAEQRDATCDQSCKQDFSDALSGAGSAPGIFGVGEWTSESEPGIPIDDDEDSADFWQAIVRPGNNCELKFTKDNLYKAAVECGCERSPLKLMMQGQTVSMLVEGCNIVTWEGGTPWLATSEISVPCLYLPASGSIKPELAVGASRDREVNRCQVGTDRFATGGHYFVIYMPICILWCWCALISCVGFGDQLYQARRRIKGKFAGGSSGAAREEAPSAAVMAAQEWAQSQAYGSPAAEEQHWQGYDQQGHEQQGYDQQGYNEPAAGYDQQQYNQA